MVSSFLSEGIPLSQSLLQTDPCKALRQKLVYPPKAVKLTTDDSLSSDWLKLYEWLQWVQLGWCKCNRPCLLQLVCSANALLMFPESLTTERKPTIPRPWNALCWTPSTGMKLTSSQPFLKFTALCLCNWARRHNGTFHTQTWQPFPKYILSHMCSATSPLDVLWNIFLWWSLLFFGPILSQIVNQGTRQNFQMIIKVTNYERIS